MLRVIKGFLLLLLFATAGLVVYVYVNPERAAQFAVSAERDRSGLVRKEVELPGGLHYVYLEGGQGEPLLLLHGFGANKDNFTRISRFLTTHYHVIIPDHIGFGESSHPQDADYSPLAQVERLRLLAETLGIKGLHLGGSSMGGQIAASYAAKYPAEVKSLWLLDPGGAWSAPDSDLARMIKGGGRNPLMASNEQEFADIFKFVMSDPPLIPRPFLNVFAQERIRNFALEQRIFDQIRGDKGLEARLAGNPTPALIVFGAEDHAINPASAKVFQRLLPHSQVVIMPGVGHLPMIEQPKISAADYLAFRFGLKN